MEVQSTSAPFAVILSDTRNECEWAYHVRWCRRCGSFLYRPAAPSQSPFEWVTLKSRGERVTRAGAKPGSPERLAELLREHRVLEDCDEVLAHEGETTRHLFLADVRTLRENVAALLKKYPE